MPSLYLINPNCQRPQQYGAEVVAQLSGTRIAAIADLAIARSAIALHFSRQVESGSTTYRPGTLPTQGPEESELWGRVAALSRQYPLAASHLGASLVLFMQQRMLLHAV